MGVYNHYESWFTSVERWPPRKDYKPPVLTLYWTTPLRSPVHRLTSEMRWRYIYFVILHSQIKWECYTHKYISRFGFGFRHTFLFLYIHTRVCVLCRTQPRVWDEMGVYNLLDFAFSFDFLILVIFWIFFLFFFFRWFWGWFQGII